MASDSTPITPRSAAAKLASSRYVPQIGKVITTELDESLGIVDTQVQEAKPKSPFPLAKSGSRIKMPSSTETDIDDMMRPDPLEDEISLGSAPFGSLTRSKASEYARKVARQTEMDELSSVGGGSVASSGSTGESSRRGSVARLKVGMRVEVCEGPYKGKVGTLRFFGPVQFSGGQWAGVELDDPSGKCDGTVQGFRYFACAPNCGIFTKRTMLRVAEGEDDIEQIQRSASLATKVKVEMNRQMMKSSVARPRGPTSSTYREWENQPDGERALSGTLTDFGDSLGGPPPPISAVPEEPERSNKPLADRIVDRIRAAKDRIQQQESLRRVSEHELASRLTHMLLEKKNALGPNEVSHPLSVPLADPEGQEVARAAMGFASAQAKLIKEMRQAKIAAAEKSEADEEEEEDESKKPSALRKRSKSLGGSLIEKRSMDAAAKQAKAQPKKADPQGHQLLSAYLAQKRGRSRNGRDSDRDSDAGSVSGRSEDSVSSNSRTRPSPTSRDLGPQRAKPIATTSLVSRSAASTRLGRTTPTTASAASSKPRSVLDSISRAKTPGDSSVSSSRAHTPPSVGGDDDRSREPSISEPEPSVSMLAPVPFAPRRPNRELSDDQLESLGLNSTNPLETPIPADGPPVSVEQLDKDRSRLEKVTSQLDKVIDTVKTVQTPRSTTPNPPTKLPVITKRIVLGSSATPVPNINVNAAKDKAVADGDRERERLLNARNRGAADQSPRNPDDSPGRPSFEKIDPTRPSEDVEALLAKFPQKMPEISGPKVSARDVAASAMVSKHNPVTPRTLERSKSMGSFTPRDPVTPRTKFADTKRATEELKRAAEREAARALIDSVVSRTMNALHNDGPEFEYERPVTSQAKKGSITQPSTMFSSVVSSDDPPTSPEPPKPPPDPSKDLGGMAEYLQQIMPPSFQTQVAPVQTSEDGFTEDDLTEALGGASATSMLLASELSAKKKEALPAVVDKRPKRSFSLASFPGLDAEKPPDDKPVDFKQLVFNYRRKQWQNRELYEREENFDVDLARLNEANNDMELEAGFVRKALMEEKKNTWDLRKFNYEYESDDEFEFDDDKEIDKLIETVIAQAENVPEIPDPDAPAPEPAPALSRKPSMAPGSSALAAMLPRATSVSGSQSARYAPSRMQDLPPPEEVKKLPSSVKVFIFDLCGTLVDDRVKLFHDMIPLVCVAFVSALKSSGIHIFPEDAMKHAGKYVHTALDGLLREHGPFIKNETEAKSFAEDVLNNFVKALQRHFKEITQEIPGATETLQMLKSRGYRLALSCETPRFVIEHCLSTFGWTDLFDCVTYSEKVQGGKPSPVQILDAMNQLGVYDAKQVVKIGDTKFDLQEAKSAGVQSIAVLSGVLSQKAVSKLKPDYVIGSVSDISRILP